MPPRRKPTSTTKKKAATKLKRAVKRGDLAPEPKKPAKTSRGPPVSDAVQASRKLQSAFVTLPERFLEKTRLLASTLPLPRPLPVETRLFPTANFDVDLTLTCPRRPKWRFDMSKLEVERNEEGVFRKWLEQTDQAVEQWQNPLKTDQGDEVPSDKPPSADTAPTSMPRSTTYYERNIEVWRQLWRVTEISQIILVLLDSRAPLLHYPPSLADYLSERRVILVLTKVDISGPERAEAWSQYFKSHYPNLRVVQVEAYIEKEATAVHQGRKQHDPHLPESFRRRLVEAIQEVHAAMLEPPEKVKANPARLEKWKPPVKREIDWERVLVADGEKVGAAVGGAAAPHEDDAAEDAEPKFLTIGLIGQPNVGKSSLLNALFGTHKVRASKTPGKTKHFQTLFWTPDVRLVDCPGLVMPNFVPMEMQVLCGILPISRVSAIPSCVHLASELLPVEEVFKLVKPTQDAVVDKRTWRDGTTRAGGGGSERKEAPWTAMDVLIAYADSKGWVTAKAGRPDVHRAGNAILRALAEGRVAWAFWPPDYATATLEAEGAGAGGAGVWIPRTDADEAGVTDEESEEEEEEPEAGEGGDGLNKSEEASSEADEADEDEGEDEDETAGIKVGAGRFGALQDIEDVDTSEDEDED
ncbi:hypothetical protein C8R46DRAFT_1349951 [Mycena filopes]|nr:hypothetical protein C8R46DRAFT_1349951 [Mycena filopes]